MDGVGFDRLVKSLVEEGTRRTALARLAALMLIGGGALGVEESEAGREHRRNLRHRRNRDNRKGKRKGNNDTPPRGGAPGVDCRQPGNHGKICNDTTRQPPRRCCNGECFPFPDCIPAGKTTGILCGPGGDCRGADRLCCSGWGGCEMYEGSDCGCSLAELGEGCSSDGDCSEGICICGVCR